MQFRCGLTRYEALKSKSTHVQLFNFNFNFFLIVIIINQIDQHYNSITTDHPKKKKKLHLPSCTSLFKNLQNIIVLVLDLWHFKIIVYSLSD